MSTINAMKIQETISIHGLIDKLFVTCKNMSDILEIVNKVFSMNINVTEQDLSARKFKLLEYKYQLERLLRIPKIEQRTDAWYEVRKGIITASEFAQALGKAKFGTQKQFYQKKCGYDEEKSFNFSAPPLKWGTMFEQVACDIYASRTKQIVHDFGLLKHPNIDWFGASPDGITNNGIMVEIKCPYQRKITGEVPAQYYYQIQGQLSVCDLIECDYVECTFHEYDDIAEWIDSALPGQEMGVIIEFGTTLGDKEFKYKYSPIWSSETITEDNVKTFINENIHNTFESYYDNTIVRFWILDVYNVVRVYRDDAFLEEKFKILKLVWDNIQVYKNNSDLYKAAVQGRRVSNVTPVPVLNNDSSGGLLESKDQYLFLDD